MLITVLFSCRCLLRICCTCIHSLHVEEKWFA
jgi:hypothetical protein